MSNCHKLIGIQSNYLQWCSYYIVGINTFLALFWAYIGQPDNHIGWATLMPFASIYSTNPRTNPWNFRKKILRIDGAGKWHFVVFFVFGSWVSQTKNVLSLKITMTFIGGSFYFCTIDGFTSPDLEHSLKTTYHNLKSSLGSDRTSSIMFVT